MANIWIEWDIGSSCFCLSGYHFIEQKRGKMIIDEKQHFKNRAINKVIDMRDVVNGRLAEVVGELKAGKFVSGHILLSVREVLESIDRLKKTITKA